MDNPREPSIDAIKKKLESLNDYLNNYSYNISSKYQNNYMTYDTKKKTDNFILNETNDIRRMIKNVFPKMADNQYYQNVSFTKFLQLIKEINGTFRELDIKLKIPDKFDANFEITKVQSSSNFNQYILYFIFAIFIIGCLIYISKKPEAGNIDMFILALAILIIIYYLYDYVVNKNGKKKIW